MGLHKYSLENTQLAIYQKCGNSFKICT